MTDDNFVAITCTDCDCVFVVHISDLSKIESGRCKDCESERVEREERVTLERRG